MEPLTAIQTAVGAYRLYTRAAKVYEDSLWRGLTFTEAEEARFLITDNVADPAEVHVDLWPTREGCAYVAVMDRRQPDHRTMGVGWDRWIRERERLWEAPLHRLEQRGFRVEAQGLHGFTVPARRR